MAPKDTTLMARKGGSGGVLSSFRDDDSKGSARMTLENVPRPRDLSFTYRTGAWIHSSF